MKRPEGRGKNKRRDVVSRRPTSVDEGQDRADLVLLVFEEGSEQIPAVPDMARLADQVESETDDDA